MEWAEYLFQFHATKLQTGILVCKKDVSATRLNAAGMEFSHWIYAIKEGHIRTELLIIAILDGAKVLVSAALWIEERFNRIMPNPRKNLIYICGDKWEYRLIKTRFIVASDNLEHIIEKYVLPQNLKKSNIVVLCQKIVSITQGKIIYKKDVKLGFWAKFLSKFVKKTPYGFSVGNPLKMQVAINLAGLPKILFASFCGIFGKIFGIKGVFYKVAGHQINQIDGFYGEAFSEYNNMAILGFSDKFGNNLCDKLREKYNLSFAIADINDIGGNIVGTSSNIKDKTKLILSLLKSNPAGQSNQQTPIIILRLT